MLGPFEWAYPCADNDFVIVEFLLGARLGVSNGDVPTLGVRVAIGTANVDNIGVITESSFKVVVRKGLHICSQVLSAQPASPLGVRGRWHRQRRETELTMCTRDEVECDSDDRGFVPTYSEQRQGRLAQQPRHPRGWNL